MKQFNILFLLLATIPLIAMEEEEGTRSKRRKVVVAREIVPAHPARAAAAAAAESDADVAPPASKRSKASKDSGRRKRDDAEDAEVVVEEKASESRLVVRVKRKKETPALTPTQVHLKYNMPFDQWIQLFPQYRSDNDLKPGTMTPAGIFYLMTKQFPPEISMRIASYLLGGINPLLLGTHDKLSPSLVVTHYTSNYQIERIRLPDDSYNIFIHCEHDPICRVGTNNVFHTLHPFYRKSRHNRRNPEKLLCIAPLLTQANHGSVVKVIVQTDDAYITADDASRIRRWKLQPFTDLAQHLQRKESLSLYEVLLLLHKQKGGIFELPEETDLQHMLEYIKTVDDEIEAELARRKAIIDAQLAAQLEADLLAMDEEEGELGAEGPDAYH